MSKPDVWFADCESFIHDTIWVFKSKRTGQYVEIVNDNDALDLFLYEHPDVWLCGFNFRGYDQYILKAGLLDWSSEQIKELSDAIVTESEQAAWELLGPEVWDVTVPPVIDLIHDIVPRKSLKEIEANIGMNIQETSVDFNIDRELTPEEIELTLGYCRHDVDATEALYYLRLDYIKTKKTLCTLADLDDAEMMKNTNARVVSEALHAKLTDPIEAFGLELFWDVVRSDIVDVSRLPECVVQFCRSIDTLSGMDEKIEPILFDLWGTPTVMGIGGIHASTGVIDDSPYKSGPRKGKPRHIAISTPKCFKTTEDRLLLIQDIGSFYPSMMILFDYLSRAIPGDYRHIYKEFYDMRMTAKHQASECERSGDAKGAKHWKDIANAAKLVLNTVYGCMKNKYNKLYDPFMATCVCLSGQLFIIDLMNRIHDAVPDFEIVQLNTDGWVLSIPREDKPALDAVIEQWKKETGFAVDTDIISQLWQRDVNNYVMEFDTGKVKAKGGTVSHYTGGNFKANSATIIDNALVQKMLYDVPVEETINSCVDLERFQLVLKAGHTYDYCCRTRKNKEVKLEGRVHRIFAVPSGWEFKKVKEGGNPAKFPDTPENAAEDFIIKSVDQIDKQWYINLANKKLEAFVA